MKIYNDLNAEIPHGDINEKTNMITIVEFYGIKFTSRTFQLEVELKQSMVVLPDEFLGNCFIKTTSQQKPEIELKITEMQEKEKEVETVNEEVQLEEEDMKEEQKVEDMELTKETETNEIIGLIPNSLELSEFDFDIVERLEESEPLQLKRPVDQYYNEYNLLISRANKLKTELRRIYLEAKFLKDKHSLVVADINKNIDSDIDISDNEDDDV